MTTEDGKVFEADACVVALPLGVLKANLVRFEPKLPEWKEAAIADLAVGNENKIALFFEKVCWPNVEFLGVVAQTSYGCSYFLNLHKATGHPVLVYMPAGNPLFFGLSHVCSSSRYYVSCIVIGRKGCRNSH